MSSEPHLGKPLIDSHVCVGCFHFLTLILVEILSSDKYRSAFVVDLSSSVQLDEPAGRQQAWALILPASSFISLCTTCKIDHAGDSV